MPSADFFAKLGLYVVKDFFDADACARYRKETRASTGEKAQIGGDLEGPVVDESVRRATDILVGSSTASSVLACLQALKPHLEVHFKVALTDCEEPQFLAYKPGDFYLPHTDNFDKSGVATTLAKRKVTAVIFLNSEAVAPGRDTYSGGSLTFYGLIDEPRWRDCGFSLVGEAGLLIAFRADILHEVPPVTHGERHTIVTWFF